MPLKLQSNIGFIDEIKFKKTLITNYIFLSQIFRRIKAGYSPIIIICGKQRVGKSMIGVWICYLMMKLLGKDYDPTKNTFYEPMKAIDDLGEMNKEPLLIDEAGSLLTKREWYKQTHIALDKIIQTQGYKTMLYIFISPFLSDIDKTFQKHFDFLLRVDSRGDFKSFKIKKKYDEFRIDKSSWKLFLGWHRIRLSTIPKEIWKKYMSYSIAKKEEIRKKIVAENKMKQEAENDPFKRLAKKMGISYGKHI